MTPEFDLINRYFTRPAKHAILGIGDDAALLRVSSGTALAVSVDTLVSGHHFEIFSDARSIGYKSLAVNLSDMAAMGAVPRWATLALTLPIIDPGWLSGFAEGFFMLADESGVELVGGDTTAGPLAVTVQIMGEVLPEIALRRDGALPGDDIWVSGTLGDAAAALAIRQGRCRLEGPQRLKLERKLDWPQPRLLLGLKLRGLAHAAIDISDGLLADVGHIAERSCIKAIINFERLPRSAEIDALGDEQLIEECQLSGGDDYELCFAASPDSRDELARLSGSLGLMLTLIGSFASGEGVVLMKNNQEVNLPDSLGFDHFA
ncbi:MAG TPA: thiamine-phosphate kinase [Burkholderiales bacterium]|nr:thiamine-phosphate kinase [Burkholderiales bacterium]